MRSLLFALLLMLIPRPLLAHAMQHSGGAIPADLWAHWNFAPSLWIGLALTLFLYLRGAATYPIAPQRFASFLVALAILFVALISPLDAVSASLFSAHMIQHLLLILVAAPLLVWSRPLAPLLRGLRGLRPSWRKAVGSVSHARPLQAVWLWLTAPTIAALLHIIALGGWHLPALYSAALTNSNLHVLEHASFFGTALCFWWAIGYVDTYGGRVLALFGVMMASGLLGALLTFAPVPWYGDHAPSVAAWGLTPLEDQQLAGLWMWIPAGTIYVVVTALLLGTWLNTVEKRSLERERRLLENLHEG